jgi:hypothetical protein
MFGSYFSQTVHALQITVTQLLSAVMNEYNSLLSLRWPIDSEFKLQPGFDKPSFNTHHFDFKFQPHVYFPGDKNAIIIHSSSEHWDVWKSAL